MPHTHHHNDSSETGEGTSKIKGAFILNLVFTVLEIIGGLYTNSIAILSDAVHDLGDSITLGLSLLFEHLSRRGRTEQSTFGYKRYSILGALLSAMVLIIGSSFIIYEAAGRLLSPEEVHPVGMLVMAVIGIIFNGLAVLKLRGGKKLNEKVVLMHLLEDVLGWAAVLIVSVVLLFYNIPILDPILSLGITVFILFRIIPVFFQVGKIFMQYAPQDIDLTKIRAEVEKSEKVTQIHDVHLWTLDGVNHVFSCHAVVPSGAGVQDLQNIKREIRSVLKTHGITHATIETEPEGEICEDCEQSD